MRIKNYEKVHYGKIVEELNQVKAAKGLSAKTIGDIAEISITSVNNVLRGLVSPTLLPVIADSIGVDIIVLLTGKDCSYYIKNHIKK